MTHVEWLYTLTPHVLQFLELDGYIYFTLRLITCNNNLPHLLLIHLNQVKITNIFNNNGLKLRLNYEVLTVVTSYFSFPVAVLHVLSTFHSIFQSQYFARADVSLPGFSKFFSEASKEERSHAEKLMEYINKRGGDVQMKEIKVKSMLFFVSK